MISQYNFINNIVWCIIIEKVVRCTNRYEFTFTADQANILCSGETLTAKLECVLITAGERFRIMLFVAMAWQQNIVDHILFPLHLKFFIFVRFAYSVYCKIVVELIWEEFACIRI